jgi:hypothetical protein
MSIGNKPTATEEQVAKTLKEQAKTREDVDEMMAGELPLILDEDDMASNSDLAIATQQSVKAYVDNEIVTDHGSLSGLADDDHTQYVETTGDETIAGVKTFSSFPVTPSEEPTTDYQAANKKYVDETGGDHGGLTGLADDDHSQYMKAEASATDNALVRWDGTGGRDVQNSGATLTDGGVLTVADYIYTPGLRVGGTGDPGTDAKIANNIAIGGTATVFTSGANSNNWDCEYNSIAGTLIFISSDKRHKEDFDYDIDGLKIVGKLKPVAFKFKNGEKREFGFIAQEAIKAHDYLAWHDKEQDKWGISGWRGYAAVLVKSVQELTKRVEELEKRLNEATD